MDDRVNRGPAPAERPAGKAAEGTGRAGEVPREVSDLLLAALRDPDALAQNVAGLVEEIGKAASAYLKPREEGKASFDVGWISDAVKTFAAVGAFWMEDPDRAAEAQRRLWSGYIDLWTNSMKRMLGTSGPAAAEPDPGDRRFRDPEWSSNHFFDFIKQLYLITSRWADGLIRDADDVDDHTRRKAEFYLRQLAAALAPSNFVLTNPELFRATLASNAENLVHGMRMLAEDLKAGAGDLRIRHSAPGFVVGRDLATTPGKVVAENEVCQLIQYEAVTSEVLKRPLLIVPPWINKFYVLDLTAEKSFIRWCAEAGHTVFVVSWVNPDARQAEKGFEQYMREGVLESLDTIATITGEKQVNTIGYCVGGTLLAVTLAYLAARRDRRIASATLFASQVDFTYAGDLKVFAGEDQIADVEADMKRTGYLEGKRMANAFNMLRPNDLIWPYFVNAYMLGKEPAPFDLLFWNADATRMPAANHSFYLRNCYLENRLAKGTMTIANTLLDLRKVKVPIYNLATREDHIAPAQSVHFGSQYFGGPVEFVVAGSGHIAGVINPPAKSKYTFWTGPAPGTASTIDAWYAAATEHPGSWWPHWNDWVRKLDGRMVKARPIGGGKVRPIEDAPGSYVLVKS